MRRRTLLAGAAFGMTAGSGCLEGLALQINCPDRDLDEELSYEERDPETAIFDIEEGNEGAALVTSPEEVDEFDYTGTHYEFGGKDEEWVVGTNFDDQVVLGVQIGSSGGSKGFYVLGVEREDSETVHAYTCIAKRGVTDDWVPYPKLLRIPHYGQILTTAKLTQWEDGDTWTVEGRTAHPHDT